MRVKRIKRVSIIGTQIIMLLSLTINAQNLKDFDGNIYKTVTLSVQTWTASNLNVSHFRNGDVIPQAKTQEEWTNAVKSGSPAWCFYENDPENGKKYGKLYNWFAINDPRGLAPGGWHIAANSDWSTLVKNLLGVDVAGIKLKSATGWKSKKGTDKIGFTALPAGYRDPDGKFKDIGITCRWWSNSVPVDVKPSNKIFSLMLNDFTPEVQYIQSEKGAGFSVRCRKD